MTKEELLKKIDFEKSWLCDCGIFGYDVDIAFHAIKNSVIEALEQEPKTDTWSIKDVADTLAKHGLMAEQEPKICHWIRQTDGYHDYYKCEQCGIAVGLYDVKNYCPNCGAKMEEGAE